MTNTNDNSPHRATRKNECSLWHKFDHKNLEIDFLHSLDFCPDAISELKVDKNTALRLRELISHWIECGRPHPVLIRGKNWGYDDDSLLQELVDFSVNYLKNA